MRSGIIVAFIAILFTSVQFGLVEAQTNLRDFLLNPQCSNACAFGIIPGQTTVEQFQITLNQISSDYRVSSIGQSGSVQIYDINLASVPSFIQDLAYDVSVLTGTDVVGDVSFEVINVTLQDVLSWFGAPNAVATNDNPTNKIYDLLYANLGLRFTVGSDGQTVEAVTLRGVSGITALISQGSFPCVDASVACSVATATNTPPPTRTFTPTNTRTPTLTPSPTSTPTPAPPSTGCSYVTAAASGSPALPAANTELLTNPSFASNLNNWSFADDTHQWNSGYSGSLLIAPASTAAGSFGKFYQSPTNIHAVAGQVYELTITARTTNSARSLTLVGRNSDWTQRYSCQFNVPFTGGVQTYRMRFMPQVSFSNLTVSGWVSGATALGLQVSEVHLQRRTGVTVNGVVEGAVLPPANTDLVTNGNFSAGMNSWGTWNAHSRIATVGGSSALEIARDADTTDGGGFYQILPYSAPANGLFSLSFRLGNTSGTTRRITLIVRDSDWREVRSCIVDIPATTALTPYTMRLRTINAWANMTVQGWIDVGDYMGTPPNNIYPFQVDDVNLQYQPGMSLTGNIDCSQAGGMQGMSLAVQGAEGLTTGTPAPVIGPSATPVGFALPTATPLPNVPLGAPTLTPSRTPSPTRMPSATRTPRR
jgi:hypothetical protein